MLIVFTGLRGITTVTLVEKEDLQRDIVEIRIPYQFGFNLLSNKCMHVLQQA